MVVRRMMMMKMIMIVMIMVIGLLKFRALNPDQEGLKGPGEEPRRGSLGVSEEGRSVIRCTVNSPLHHTQLIILSMLKPLFVRYPPLPRPTSALFVA